MSVVVNVMLSLMSVMSPPPALCNLSVRMVVKLCTLGVYALEFFCTPFPQTKQGEFPEFAIIFPPLLPTITLDFPAFIFSPLSRRISLHSVTRRPNCSIVGDISTKLTTTRNVEHFSLHWNIHDSRKLSLKILNVTIRAIN